MDKLEIKQGSFIQQTQYFIPVEIDLSVVPARLGIRFFKTDVDVNLDDVGYLKKKLSLFKFYDSLDLRPRH
jgi:hypothetical protein